MSNATRFVALTPGGLNVAQYRRLQALANIGDCRWVREGILNMPGQIDGKRLLLYAKKPADLLDTMIDKETKAFSVHLAG